MAGSLCLGMGAQNMVRLHRFDKENAELPQNAKGRVVFMGDSITESWAERAETGFFDNPQFVGRGISGEVTAQMLLRFRKDVIELHPKTVVILGGCNDIALNQGAYDEDYTMGNIISIVELAKAHKIRPVLCSVLPAAGFRWRPEVKDAPEKIASLNARIEAYAKSHKVKFVNYYPAMLSDDGRSLRPELSPDGVHPNDEGYRIMEAIVIKSL